MSGEPTDFETSDLGAAIADFHRQSTINMLKVKLSTAIVMEYTATSMNLVERHIVQPSAIANIAAALTTFGQRFTGRTPAEEHRQSARREVNNELAARESRRLQFEAVADLTALVGVEEAMEIVTEAMKLIPQSA